MIERRYTNKMVETRNEDNVRTISGVASVYYDPKDTGTQYELWNKPGSHAYERIQPGAFTRALKEQQDVCCLFNHDPDQILGRTSAGTCKLVEQRDGLHYEVPYDEQDPDHVRIMRKIEKKNVATSSFAFKVRSDEWVRDGNLDVRNVLDVDLYDVSPVTNAAYSSTSVVGRGAGTVDDAEKSFETAKRLEIMKGLQSI